MNLFIDIATLVTVSGAYYIIFLILLFVFWLKNKDIEAILWWCGFPLFRIIYTLIGTDSQSYDDHLIIHVGNLSLILSDLFLMIGCLKFAEINIKFNYIYGFVGLFVAIAAYQYFIGAGLTDRTKIVVAFDVFPIVTSLYALTHLNSDNYRLEKYFTMFWVSFQLGVFGFWVVINFNFSDEKFGLMVLLSLSIAYLSHIFIMVGLIILTIAKRRNQLIEESVKHKALEKSLETALYDAQLANEEKTQFLTNMSHELRTPLNAIIGFSESMKLKFYGTLNEKQTEYIDNIHDGGELLLKLVTDLLNLSHVEEGKVDISPENINLNMLIKKTRPLLEEIVENSGIKFHIQNNLENDENLSPVYIDQVRIKQILINFVSNAAKYGKDDGNIHLIVEDQSDEYYRISVSDEGEGIKEDQYENIFKPFNRAGNENSNIEGIGLGLSIAKKLIEEMHGYIGFESELGIGSIFWIDIPKSKQRELALK